MTVACARRVLAGLTARNGCAQQDHHSQDYLEWNQVWPFQGALIRSIYVFGEGRGGGGTNPGGWFIFPFFILIFLQLNAADGGTATTVLDSVHATLHFTVIIADAYDAVVGLDRSAACMANASQWAKPWQNMGRFTMTKIVPKAPCSLDVSATRGGQDTIAPSPNAHEAMIR